MRISLPLLALVLCACAGAGVDPAACANWLADLGAGFIPAAINNGGQAAGALYFAEAGKFRSSTTYWKA
jgi:hypothetical protein